MKTIIFYCTVIVLAFYSCTTRQTNVPSADVKSLLDSGNFMFMANSVMISNPDVINIMSSMPNSSYSRAQNLDYGYGITFKNNEMTVELPYFGRLYNPSYDTTKNSFRFTSKDFTKNQGHNKRGNMVYTIKTNDQQNVKTIYMEIYSNGKAYISIDSNDRQPISYDGYIMKSEATK